MGSLFQNGGKPLTANRVAIGPSLAVLFCPAANGKVFGVTIDREDLPRVLAFGAWRIANFDSANGRVNLYCYCKSKGRHVYLHRFILDAPTDRRIEVDHQHHRNFDNRKAEIRLVTKSQNQRNRRDNHKRWARRAA